MNLECSHRSQMAAVSVVWPTADCLSNASDEIGVCSINKLQWKPSSLDCTDAAHIADQDSASITTFCSSPVIGIDSDDAFSM